MKFIKFYVISWWCKIKILAAGEEGNGCFLAFLQSEMSLLSKCLRAEQLAITLVSSTP